jgi:hypothetical protein
MKVLFSDGYIETNANGNTYCGESANKLMLEAQRVSRELKYDYQIVLHYMLVQYKKAYKKALAEVRKKSYLRSI